MRLRCLVVLALLLGGPSALAAQRTRAERTSARETSTHAEVLAFVDSLQAAGADIRIGQLGQSPEGRAIPYVLAARPMVLTPGEAHRTGKPVIYIQGNIHAGEVEGKEAAQMLLRDLTLGPLRPLLDSVILLVVPIYNADGNDHMAPGERNRPGQNGPALVGERGNGQGLDLNRDYVKQEAPETRGALGLLARWEPDVFIDLHTTNGSYHGYALTFSPGLSPNANPANDWTRDHFLPTVRERMRTRHRQETFWYGNFRNQEPDSLTQGWETYESKPRFGTNAMGLRGMVSILSEAYSNAPFSERIEASYNFVREVLSLAAEERNTLLRLVAASGAARPDSVAVRSALAPPTEQVVIAEITEADGDGSHGFARRRRTGVFRKIRMPVFDRFAATESVPLPAGYLLPPQHQHLVTLLQRHGLLVERAAAPARASIEQFRVDSVSAAPFPFEGHRLVSVAGTWTARDTTLPAGWYYVSTAQRGGVLAAFLLEPRSEDGFVAWNLLDRDLRRGRGYPVWRAVRRPAVAMHAVPHPDYSSPLVTEF